MLNRTLQNMVNAVTNHGHILKLLHMKEDGITRLSPRSRRRSAVEAKFIVVSTATDVQRMLRRGIVVIPWAVTCD
jgi:hypothetical protein